MIDKMNAKSPPCHLHATGIQAAWFHFLIQRSSEVRLHEEGQLCNVLSREAGRQGTVIKVCTWPFPGLGTGPGIEPSVTPLSNTFPSSSYCSCSSCSWCWIHFHSLSLSQSTLIHPCPPLINPSVDKKPCQSSSNHSDPLILMLYC